MQFNQKLHSSKLYNGFQFTVSALAVFSGSTYNSMKKHQETLTCFVAGTMILTASGLVAIEKIKSGDKVISTYPETMETSPKAVLETYIREVTTLVHLTVNGQEIVTTVDHPFYVKNQGFIKAGELAVGDELLDSNKNILLVENFDVELTDEPTTVYNFQVEDYHTYHVSGFGVLVHNAEYSPEKMQKIKARQKAGHEYEKNQHEKLKQKNPTAEAQVRVKPIDDSGNAMSKGGNYLDDLYINEQGQFEINEYKLGPKSPYQKNQISNGFPEKATNKDMMITSGSHTGEILPKGTRVNTYRKE